MGETIIDPFMGAGWVGAAVIPMGRKFIGIEIDEKWFTAACERVENVQRQKRLFA